MIVFVSAPYTQKLIRDRLTVLFMKNIHPQLSLNFFIETILPQDVQIEQIKLLTYLEGELNIVLAKQF